MKKKIFLLSFFSFFTFAVWADAPTNIYVDDDWSSLPAGTDPDGSGPATQIGVDAFSSITPAIAAIADGGTIHIADGFYTEQLFLSHNLTLQGSSTNTIIQSPTTLTEAFNTGVSNKPIIWVHDATVSIRDMAIDGLGLGNSNYRFMGIAFLNASGTLDSLEVRNIQNTPLDGTQHGIGIYARTTTTTDQTISITHNTIHDYQKNGMAIVGSHLNTTITDNTVTGSGDTPLIAQNGIQLSYGATGTITRNTIRANSCTSVAGHCTDDPTTLTSDSAAGILIFSPGNSPIEISDNTLENNQSNISVLGSTAYFSDETQLSVNIHGNTIHGGQIGVAFYDVDGSIPITGNIFQNIITDQQYGLFVRDDTPGETPPTVTAHLNQITGNTIQGAWSNTAVDARQNWWGCSAGSELTPGPCDSHTALVNTNDQLPSSDISGSGGISGSSGDSGGASGVGGSSGSEGSSTGGSTENPSGTGGVGTPTGEEAGISGQGTGTGGTAGDSGTVTGTENNLNASGCSCHVMQ